MKKYLIVISFFIVYLSASFATAATQIGLWEFEGNYNDSLGNYNMTEYGTVPFVSGVGGGLAADFDGGVTNNPPAPGSLDFLDSGANRPNVSSFNSAGMSIMGWVNLNSTALGGIVSQDSSASSYLDYGYGLTNYNGYLSLYIREADNGWTPDHSIRGMTHNLLDINEWIHFAAIWDGNYSGGIQMYLNGSPVDTDIDVSGTFTGMKGNSVSLRLGATHGDSAQKLRGMDGQLDNLSLWQGALTSQEVLADYQATVVPEPISSILFVTGGTLLAGRRYLKRKV